MSPTTVTCSASICCCTRCQRRTGSFFGVTSYFRPSQVEARTGGEKTFHLPEGETTFHLCPQCGTSLWYEPDDASADMIGVSGGCFTDKTLPSPVRMVQTVNRHPFVRTPPGTPEYEEWPPE